MESKGSAKRKRLAADLRAIMPANRAIKIDEVSMQKNYLAFEVGMMTITKKWGKRPFAFTTLWVRLIKSTPARKQTGQ